MEFSRQEYWSGLPFPPPGDLPDSGIEPTYLHIMRLQHWQANSFTTVLPGKPKLGCTSVWFSLSVLSSLRPHGLQPARVLCSWDFPGKNTGVGCHFLLQGIFLTQGMNLHLLRLLHCQAIVYLSHLGKPLEEEMATHSSILAWEIPWMEEPGGLQSVGLQRAGHDLMTKQ